MTEMKRTESVARKRRYWWACCWIIAPPAKTPWTSLPAWPTRPERESSGGSLSAASARRDHLSRQGQAQRIAAVGRRRPMPTLSCSTTISRRPKSAIWKQALSIKVLDRTELILDIFAGRAQTYESRLAVEMAQLQYSLPRLKRMWTHLSRLKMGIGMRGPGEKQLEVDRRLVEKRIHDLGLELKGIQRRKEREVAARHDRMTVSLVGYTNAGKSTLLNVLTGADVLAEDKLFATLDTRTRRWQLPGWGPVLLSDTVGFIRDLPHHLIASFKATLEEARQADLLLHVADASDPAALAQITAVYGVLEELGIEAKDTLLVLNKIDALPDRSARR